MGAETSVNNEFVEVGGGGLSECDRGRFGEQVLS